MSYRTVMTIGGRVLGLAVLTWPPTRAARSPRCYRLLEGGADNDEVYTFAFFHSAVAGVRIRL